MFGDCNAMRRILVSDIYRKESAYAIYPASRHPWWAPVYWFKLACPRNSYLDKSHQKLLSTFLSSIPTFQMESKDYRSVPDDEFEESYRYSGAHHSLQRTNKWGIVRLILLDQLFNTVLISILLWALLPTSCLPFSKIGILDNECRSTLNYTNIKR
jgi:hypothetical protein